MINFESLATELLKDDVVMERHNLNIGEPAISWIEYADSIGMDEFGYEMFLDEDEEGICITSIRNSKAHNFEDFETPEEMAEAVKETVKKFYNDL